MHKKSRNYYLLPIVLLLGVSACSDDAGNATSSSNASPLIGEWRLTNCDSRYKPIDRQIKAMRKAGKDEDQINFYVERLKAHKTIDSLAKLEITESNFNLYAPDEYRRLGDSFDNKLDVELLMEFPYTIKKIVGNNFIEVEYVDEGLVLSATMTVDGDTLKFNKGLKSIYRSREMCSWIRES